MLKGGIFLDMENLNRCGGWNIRFDAIRELVEAQDVVIVRANAYMAVDLQRERMDEEYSRKKEEYRMVVRRAGFHVVTKEVQRFKNEDDEWVFKANADIDLAIEALIQSQQLDYVLLGTGDGDFIRLVHALQDRGKRVDLLSFGNTSDALRKQVDNHLSGWLYPDILPTFEDGSERVRGYLHMVNEDKGFGFATVQTGFGPYDVRTDVFVHITDFVDSIDNREFGYLKTRGRILEFSLFELEDERCQAKDITLVNM